MKILQGLSRTGVGVLIVIHDLNLAAVYADRLVLMKEGRILMDGTPNDVLQPKIIEETFSHPVSVSRHPFIDRPLIIPDVQNTPHERDVPCLQKRTIDEYQEGEELPCFKTKRPKKSFAI